MLLLVFVLLSPLLSAADADADADAADDAAAAADAADDDDDYDDDDDDDDDDDTDDTDADADDAAFSSWSSHIYIYMSTDELHLTPLWTPVDPPWTQETPNPCTTTLSGLIKQIPSDRLRDFFRPHNFTAPYGCFLKWWYPENTQK